MKIKQAQKNGWTTGTWGTVKYYIDDHQDMYIGKGTYQWDIKLEHSLI